MLRGEVRLVDLDPVPGAEASKRRPAIIVSNDSANSTAARLGRGVVTVVPVTSNVETGLGMAEPVGRQAQEQAATASRRRIRPRSG